MPIAITRLFFLFVIAAGSVLSSCSVYKPYYSRDAENWQAETPPDSTGIKYTVFLIGDAGQPETKRQEPTLKLLQGQLEKADMNSACIFLGDNLYYYGMTEENSSGRKEDERRLNEQLKIMKNFKGEKYLIPGNHDWANGRPEGMANALRQEAFVEAQFPITNTFVPDSACPGPYEVLLYDDILMIALNSHWWLHDEEKPYGENNYCGVANEVDLLVQLESLIQKHKGKHILVVAHHPLFSNGLHGGHFTIKDHIFPLTLIRDWAFVPLPVIGSLYPFARKYGGIIQDIPHPRYRAYRDGLLAIFDKYPNIIYAAGHEHSLQYFKHKAQHHIISGAGCKKNYAASGHGATFAYRSKGFAKVHYYHNGEVWVEFWQPGDSEEEDGSTGKVLYRGSMYAKAQPDSVYYGPEIDFQDSTVTVAVNPDYQAGKFKKMLLGEHYRKEWTTPVTMPVLDMKREKGGLKPYKIGGGKQTSSLKLRNQQGREYTLRLIRKDASRSLPDVLLETIAEDIFQDQFSSQHPYGPMVVPALADAAGVYHTNPKLVYIPRDPRLGQWIDQFGNQVAMLEEDPDESHEEVESLGKGIKFSGTDKLLEQLRKDNDNRVNHKFFARARLFDMLIGDWDRHEGQWRWIHHKTDKGRLYEPVPEDRDIAFFRGDGLLPWMARRKWAVRNLQHFGHDYDDIIGLNLSAISIDRNLLGQLTRQDWIEVATDLKQSITDEQIDDAVRQLPEAVYGLSGPEIASKLKNRRNNLPRAAEEYYEALAREVDVVGTDKHERFVVKRLNRDQTEVTVHKITKEGEDRGILFSRVFYRKETKEIRLYGLGGNDRFEVSGRVSKGIKVRIIGGRGDDYISDSSRVSGPTNKTVVYDYRKENNTLHLGSETKDRTEDYPEVNIYQRQGHRFPYLSPRLSAAFNVDDGLFLGGGASYRTFGFRKEPYSTDQTLVGNYAFRTQAFTFRYEGDFRQVLGKWNLNLQAAYLGPQFLFNYFGLGNDTKPVEGRPIRRDIEFYRVKFTNFHVAPMFTKNLKSFFLVGIGPTFDHFKIQRTPGRFVDLPQAGVTPEEFDRNQFAGAKMFARLGASSNEINPRLGVHWYNEVSYNYGISGTNDKFTRLGSQLVYYWSPVIPFQATLAMRFGANTLLGDFPFYQANTLGGIENLRGYRRTRFAGRSSIYQNTELRVELFKFNLYLFPGKFGVLGLVDHGRVFHKNDETKGLIKGLHSGYGGGIWIDVLKQAVITTTYSIGEEKLINVTFGFLF